ncbi:hypothetical protein PM082_024806 [Marasmius tenuissimus]|nr:hypothetical protein PM082_024806 [Marasmius tenuissimus]
MAPGTTVADEVGVVVAMGLLFGTVVKLLEAKVGANVLIPDAENVPSREVAGGDV